MLKKTPCKGVFSFPPLLRGGVLWDGGVYPPCPSLGSGPTLKLL